ncbi:MAG: Gfo/Idh/MocA family oxidoreductase [Oscillospiraceae bacterium]|jgi:predicted dehydrogenase|nr:Gfo/Idh/MocA family oxidoreductase [Oscillospiraceae bacterium]
MISIAYIGLGNRGRVYMGGLSGYEDVAVTALCDTRPVMLDHAGGRSPTATRLADDNAFFAAGKLADWLVIATPDHCHFRHAKAALQLGYHLICEKPVTANPAEMEELCALAKEKNRHVLVCHVLRYSPFYRTIKEIIESGAIGEVVNIAHEENVGYFHYAHSYVRGNWRNLSVGAPFLMAKCCHDVDLLHWFIRRPCESVSGFGGLTYFTRENMPEGAAAYCLQGCPHIKSCPYSVERLYLKRFTQLYWGKPPAAGLPYQPTRQELREALKENDYGRCVYQCDNNVHDHDSVAFRFAGGATATLSISAFSLGTTRRIRIQGTKGELWGRDHTMRIHLHKFGKAPKVLRVRNTNISGHGGSDQCFCEAAHAVMAGGPIDPENLTTIEQTRISHQICYAALQSLETGEAALVAAQ